MRKFNIKILLLLSLGHMVTDIYQGALLTTLPFLKENLSLSYTMTGVILMAANFTSSIIQPQFGFLSDKKKKPLLLPLGCICAGLGLSLLGLTSSSGGRFLRHFYRCCRAECLGDHVGSEKRKRNRRTFSKYCTF